MNMLAATRKGVVLALALAMLTGCSGANKNQEPETQPSQEAGGILTLPAPETMVASIDDILHGTDISAEQAEMIALIDAELTVGKYLSVDSKEMKIDGKDGYEVVIDAMDKTYRYQIRRSDAAILHQEITGPADGAIMESIAPTEEETDGTQKGK